jgi:hypothetical protein
MIHTRYNLLNHINEETFKLNAPKNLLFSFQFDRLTINAHNHADL